MDSVPNQGNQPQLQHLCDFCNQSKAVIHCRADSANLCLSCDREVHSTNPLFEKHHRSLLCNSCGSSPCSIFCCAELVVLCQNCDWERHKGVGGRNVHERRPIEGFSGVPTVGEFLGLLGLDDDLVKKSLDLGNRNDDEEDGGFLDMLVWETPMVVGIDDLIVGGGDGGAGLKAMGVPPLPKNRNAVCGKDKDEIVSQLRDMAKLEPNSEAHIVAQPAEFEWADPDTNPDIKAVLQEQPSMPSYDENIPKWYDFNGSVPDESFPSSFFDSVFETSHVVPDKDSEAADGTATTAHGTVQEVQSIVPFDRNTLQVPREAVAPRELNSQERDSALSRYKEKKKTRRYEKHIRYESRKVRAEGRTRIKGRFAKMDR